MGKNCTESNFDEGTYRYIIQIRVDGTYGTTHVLNKSGVTATIDGVSWKTYSVNTGIDNSFVWIDSPEYIVLKHNHSWSAEWEKDDTHHWHECTVADCTVTENNQKDGYGEHIGGTATCEEKAVCTVCGISYGELAEHTPGAKATEDSAQVCTLCGYEIAPKLEHAPMLVEGYEATETSTGKKDYYHCDSCGRNYEDVTSLKEILGDITTWGIIPKLDKPTEPTNPTVNPTTPKNPTVKPIPTKPTENQTVKTPKVKFTAGKKQIKIKYKKVKNAVGFQVRYRIKGKWKIQIRSFTKGKKQIKIKYTKVKNAVGFQVRYRIKGKWKIKTFNTKKSVTKVIKKLKKGKYKIQIRSFTKGKKTFSKWTKVKTVRVK